MSPLREQLEYAVVEAAQQERRAWQSLEEASRSDHIEPPVLEACRERWQAAAHALAEALRELKR